MQILTTKAELHSWRRAHEGITIGFVPTMGALHHGHLQLVAAALQQCQVVVASIFVNPTQFNAADDLAKYPRLPTEDAALLQEAGCHALFMPSATEVYGEADAKDQIVMHFPGLDTVWEGTHRPGHFSGVGQVVAKLFHLVQPTHAFFGEKDFQQLAVITRMVQALDFPIVVVPVATVRESSGLAMSSRNMRLSTAGRQQAQAIYACMKRCAQSLGTMTPSEAVDQASAWLTSQGDFSLEYLAIIDPMTLETLNCWAPGQPARVIIACWLEGVRLIDNMALDQ